MVPGGLDVTFDCHTGAGETSCFGRKNDGVGEAALVGTDNGADGPGGQKITLKVSNNVGNVEVRRD